MKVKSILIPVLLFVFVLLFNSCEDSSVGSSGGTTNVSGIVRGYFNIPVSNAAIYIGDKSTVTSSDGKFSFEKVSQPYDLYLKVNADTYVIEYKNVTASDLLINLPAYGVTSETQNLVVHYPTLPAGTKGRIYFMDDEKDVIGVQPIESATNMLIYAPVGLTLKGKVFLIAYTKDINQHINDYTYFATKSDVIITPGTTAEVTITQDDMKPVEELTVSYKLSLPPNNLSLYASYMLNFFGRKMSYFGNYQELETFTTNNISFLMPRNLPVEFTPTLFTAVMESNGSLQQMSVLPKTGTNLQINISSAPLILSPENNATEVDVNTKFTFQKQSLSNVLILTIRDTASNVNYRLCTSDNSITLGQMSKILTLVPNRKYAYYIEQTGVNVNSVGEYLQNGRTIPTFSGMSTQRYFTTKP